MSEDYFSKKGKQPARRDAGRGSPHDDTAKSPSDHKYMTVGSGAVPQQSARLMNMMEKDSGYGGSVPDEDHPGLTAVAGTQRPHRQQTGAIHQMWYNSQRSKLSRSINLVLELLDSLRDINAAWPAHYPSVQRTVAAEAEDIDSSFRPGLSKTDSFLPDNRRGMNPAKLRRSLTSVEDHLAESSRAAENRLKQLQMLSLRRNHFSGRLPLSLCHLTSIHLLDLSSNNLKGQILKCFKNFSAMTQESFSSYAGPHADIVNQTSGRFRYSYDLIALLMWKGVEHAFKNNNLLLKGIDLSNNQLTEEIPAEIESLVVLVSLNLSRNNLTGEIPLNIGRLTSLEFLDLSRNQLVGSIPSTLTQIDQLTMLDMSHNYLSGEIPTSTQLQSFEASCYEYNLDLCGRPLQKLCKEEESSQEPKIEFREDEDSLYGLGFYMSMAFGFVIGFWGIFGSILVKRSWRHAYFKFLNNLTDNFYVMIAVKVAKYKR